MKFNIVILLLLFTNVLLSQQLIKNKIIWNATTEAGESKLMSFEGATYNSDFLPVFIQNIKVDRSAYDIAISNEEYVTLNSEEIKILEDKNLPNSISVSKKVFKNRNQNNLALEIIPIRKNPRTNLLEKLISFDLQYTPSSRSTNSIRSQNNVGVSEMNSGHWLKIGIVKTGVYKVTYENMVERGITSPSDPRVFGYGGAVLPEYNGDEMPDDMNELSIKVEKGQDNVFNAGDYILFYAEGPLTWEYNLSYEHFLHQQHHYSDTIFYFLSNNTGASKQISSIDQSSGSGDLIDFYLDKQVHEVDNVNLLHSGKTWYGEEYNSVNEFHDFNFSFSDLVTDSMVRIHTFAAARCGEYSHINVSYNNNNIQTVDVPNVNMSSATSYYVREGSSFDRFSVNSPNFRLRTSYDQYSQYNAWLNYININSVRRLKMVDSQLLFTNIYNINGLNQYSIANANSSLLIWDVSSFSDINQINRDYSNSSLSFTDDANEIKSYVVFQPSNTYSVASIKKVDNQNLHGLENIEYVILTHRNFKTQAEKIAEYHRTKTGLSTVVVTNEEVYNEFSSGTPDITATKNLMRHLYHHRSTTDTLKYLLLFGDGSYDNKTQSSSNSNYILTFQSKGSIKVNGTFVCDDYYGLLDDNEGVTTGYLDIGIGRLVVKTTSEAENAVKKIQNYNSSQESYGSWRSLINFVADNGDGNRHIIDADDIANTVEANYPNFNLNKIYIDAYPLEESAGGDVVPEATHDFNTAINQGSLILNYTGHGGELGLAHEQLITVQDILSWKNKDRLVTFITATCEFTRYDDKNRVSAGEHVFLNPDGGGIALFTTTRIAYAGPNKVINTAFYNQLFDDNSFRMGDLIRRTKNALGTSSTNMRIFALIGDPALCLAVPKQKVSTYKINNIEANGTDTINFAPLTKVTVEGQVTDHNNQILTDFDGIVYPIVFDKADTVLSLCQFECSAPYPFKNRKSIIYKGKSSVKNGQFSFSFVVPKDISYKNGLGRISYYADNKSDDAFGYDNKIGISGTSDGGIVDNKGPEIELFMNDENFIYGGTTDESPIFIANLYDENGINTVGNGIGHDLTAKLDNDNKQLSILNTYYESDMDSYQSGKISYPYEKLDEGKHSLHFKAWDVFNNSSEQVIEFYVAKSTELAIKNIFNYPNPFTTNTDFYFDHNQANQNLDVLIQVFTVTGKLVKTIETNILTDGFRSTPINWNGKDDYNDPIGKGVYIYKLKVRTEDGENATEFQKLVILK